MKGVGRKGTEFLLQYIGKIDILLKKASEVFRSLDDAVKNEIVKGWLLAILLLWKT